MPEFGQPFSGLASDRKLTDAELIRAGEFLRLLKELAPDETHYYEKGAKEVETEFLGK